MKTKYLTDLIEKFDESIKLLEEDIVDFENDLSTLYKPFQILIKSYRKDNIQSSLKAPPALTGAPLIHPNKIEYTTDVKESMISNI